MTCAAYVQPSGKGFSGDWRVLNFTLRLSWPYAVAQGALNLGTDGLRFSDAHTCAQSLPQIAFPAQDA